MAKGQKRNSREAKKPKADKKSTAATPSLAEQISPRRVAPAGKKK